MPATPAPTPPRAAVLVVALACVAQFMLVLDDTIVNVALPTLGAELGFSERTLSWVVNAYLLTFGGFLLVGGRVADLVGPRRMFVLSLGAFAAASAACGAAGSAEVLVAARAVQGIAAALLSPAALALLLRATPDAPARGRALGAWASLIGLGAATGVLLGGAIVELVDWRWIFLINLPVAAVALALVPRLVPADARDRAATPPNVLGAALGTLALLLLVFTVVETEHAGWASARTLGGFALVVLLALAFRAGERRAASPLLPPALLRRRRAMRANGLVLVAAAGLLAMFFFMTLYLQRVLGWGPFATGAAFVPFSLSMGLASAVAGRAARRLPPRVPVAVGLLAAAGGLALLSRLEPGSSYVGAVVPGLVLTALGIGAALVVVMGLATDGAGEHSGGLASALLTTAQQVGGAIGIAVMVTVASDRTADALATGAAPPAALADGFSAAFVVMAAVLAVAAVLAAVGLRGDGGPAGAPAGRTAPGAAD
ncbi:MFS transporter [Patulibacter sp. SYSU D01012]|uniref:MFS transporter n=1 Tax=Patulibacter sp. SYSU D01012 TaxID=2817381 RepID=UPI0032BFE73B